MRKRLLATVLLLCIILSGCESASIMETTAPALTQPEITMTQTESTQTVSAQQENTASQTESTQTMIIEVESETGSSFMYEDIPRYTGSPYCIVNDNMPFFGPEDFTSDSCEYYSELDELGRCGVAYANLCKEMMPTEPRGEIGNVRPSGWHTVKYNEIIDDNYLYNRCHLIAYQLAGENANEKNLITGTRYMNIEGMQPFETMVSNYVNACDNHVLYRVTPIFIGGELVARGVLMEACSVEDEGAGVGFCVFCYNVQPGIEIDYMNGDSYVKVEPTEVEPTDIAENTEPAESADTAESTESAVTTEVTETTMVSYDYVANRNSKKFHYPDCNSVNEMKEKNKWYYNGTREELIEKGYSPCGSCKP